MVTAEGPQNGKQISVFEALQAKRFATVNEQKKKKKQINILAILSTGKAQLVTCAMVVRYLAFCFLSGQWDLPSKSPPLLHVVSDIQQFFFLFYSEWCKFSREIAGRFAAPELRKLDNDPCEGLEAPRWKWSVKVKRCKIRTGKKSLTLDMKAGVKPVWTCLYVRCSFYSPSVLFKWLQVHLAAAFSPLPINRAPHLFLPFQSRFKVPKGAVKLEPAQVYKCKILQ